MSEPNMIDRCTLELAQAIAALGVMQAHLRQMAASPEDEQRAEMYKKAAASQAAVAANLCTNVHTGLVSFIGAMVPPSRIVTPR